MPSGREHGDNHDYAFGVASYLQGEQPKLSESILVPMWLAAPIWPVPENAALPILKMPFAHVYFSLQDRAACGLRADILGPSCIDLEPPRRTGSIGGVHLNTMLGSRPYKQVSNTIT
jgi:hypothetical protein